MNWMAVSTELRRIAKAQESLIADPYKHNDIKQSAAIVSAVLKAISSALDEGMRPPLINGSDVGDLYARGGAALQVTDTAQVAPSIPPTPR